MTEGTEDRTGTEREFDLRNFDLRNFDLGNFDLRNFDLRNFDLRNRDLCVPVPLWFVPSEFSAPSASSR